MALLAVIGAGAASAAFATVSPAGATSTSTTSTSPITDAVGADAVMPINTQLGSARIALNCQMPILGQQTLIAQIQGTFATLLGGGQSFYLDDGKGSLEIPPQLVGLLRGLGSTSFNATINTLNIVSNNATPSSINALANAPIKLTNVALPTSGSAVIPIVPTGGTLSVGPFVAGPSGQVTLGLGSAGGSITLTNGIASILGTLSVNCSAPSPAVVVAGINISGTSSTVSQPTTGDKYVYPSVPLDHQIGSLKLPLSCAVSGIGNYDIPLTLTGDAGTVYGVGEKFYLKNASGALDVPSNLLSAVQSAYPAMASIQTTVTGFNVDATGATPASVNAAATPIVLSSQATNTGNPIQLRVPSTGYLNVGPFTAGAAGAMKLELGTASAVITVNSASGSVLGTVNVNCAKRSPAVIIVPLTSAPAVGGVPSYTIVGPSGSTAGGSVITFVGSGLADVREVYFGSTPAPWLAPMNGNTLFVETPPSAAGTVPVTVRALGGTTTSGTFTFK